MELLPDHDLVHQQFEQQRRCHPKSQEHQLEGNQNKPLPPLAKPLLFKGTYPLHADSNVMK
ncbi:hypothetical protein D3C76_1679200 [compost metagenome]